MEMNEEIQYEMSKVNKVSISMKTACDEFMHSGGIHH